MEFDIVPTARMYTIKSLSKAKRDLPSTSGDEQKKDHRTGSWMSLIVFDFEALITKMI